MNNSISTFIRKWRTETNMSYFISESERHAELYGTYTYEQSSALDIVQENMAHKNNSVPIVDMLHAHYVSEMKKYTG